MSHRSHALTSPGLGPFVRTLLWHCCPPDRKAALRTSYVPLPQSDLIAAKVEWRQESAALPVSAISFR